ncbi:S-layer homology domain-containing protein [Crocosphaera sp.]|uniref:S-layer homology domain-containing protein n=1 Tax=Crocosphaera sp. TaxID=2729996 RepID=UPI002619EBF0|nr:S-layer homology domain-containing protein [Crocosphaera sp.]MDJ0583318.1 S-layer homology domain-containing protein [Crocosphaera sp.]
MSRYLILSLFLTVLTACSNIDGLEGLFSPNPELQKRTENTTSSPLEIPKAFPSIIPQYSNSELQEVSDTLTEKQGFIRWSSPDSVTTITEFYQEVFKNNDWEITQPFNEDDNRLIAQKNGLEVQVSFLTSNEDNTDYSLRYQPVNTSSSSTTPDPPSSPQNNGLFPLDDVPVALRPYVQDVMRLEDLNVKQTDDKAITSNTIINRRTYARWLVQTYNSFNENTPAKQLRLGVKTSQPAFADVGTNDPDFPVIQGLAEAGIIPSPLTGNSSASLFRPDNPLTREDLITWKVPLDTGKGLPKASLDNIKETWGFQDTTKIDIKAIQALYADFQNGEQSNVRRILGYTTLFQPKKGVTLAEAIASLWYFGYQGDGLSAKEVLTINN